MKRVGGDQPEESRGERGLQRDPETAQVTRLILIRHGDTDGASKEPRDPPLSDLGAWQAGRLRDRIAVTSEMIGACRLLCSGLKRARQTAAVLARALGEAGLSPITVENLREMSWGQAEGLSWEAMIARYGGPLGPNAAFAPA